MEKDSFSLLHGPVRPALLRYALPILLSMVATQLYTVADTSQELTEVHNSSSQCQYSERHANKSFTVVPCQ